MLIHRFNLHIIRPGIIATFVIFAFTACRVNDAPPPQQASADTNFDAKDRATIKKLFHVPENAQLRSFESWPQVNNRIYGREGLYIIAMFQFDSAQYASYLNTVKNTDNWEPQHIDDINPPRNAATEASKQWSALPLNDQVIPLMLEKTLQDTSSAVFKSISALKQVENGLYYTAISKFNTGKNAKQMQYHLLETQSMNGTFYAFKAAVLDENRKRLYTFFKM